MKLELIMYLPKDTIETITETRECTINLDDEEYYIWSGELYAEYQHGHGYSKRIEIREIKTFKDYLSDAYKVFTDSKDLVYAEQLIDCSNGQSLNDPEAIINELMTCDTSSGNYDSFVTSIARLSVARDISYAYLDEGYEIECEMRDETANLINAIMKGN